MYRHNGTFVQLRIIPVLKIRKIFHKLFINSVITYKRHKYFLSNKYNNNIALLLFIFNILKVLETIICQITYCKLEKKKKKQI